MPGGRFEIHQGMPAEECRVVTDHFRPAMPNSSCPSYRNIGDRERGSCIAGKPSGESHHWAVRHFDAPKAMQFAQLDAFAEPVVCADHPSANILSVTEAAERHGLEFGRAGAPCQVEPDPVFPEAAVEVAAWET